MLFKSSVIAAALATIAISQSVPACFTSCLNSVGDGGSGCGASGLGCNCLSDTWNDAITNCVNQQCMSDDDINNAFNALDDTCTAAFSTYVGTTPIETGTDGGDGGDMTSTPAATSPSTSAPTTPAPTSPTTPAATPTASTAASSGSASPSAGSSKGGAAQVSTFGHGVVAITVVLTIAAFLS